MKQTGPITYVSDTFEYIFVHDVNSLLNIGRQLAHTQCLHVGLTCQ